MAGGLIIDTQNRIFYLFLVGGIFYVGWVIICKSKYSELQDIYYGLSLRFIY